ncbi:MlaD family protein [Paraburkholderia phymatum]|uniref:PqiB family protein n=1 Tax=Paraburkholderia phymatum TaxID=148447 RepID=UPI0031722E2A
MSPVAGPPTPEPQDPPVTRYRWRFSLIWLVPLVAVLIGLTMLVHTWLSTGPEVTISFNTATGLEAGKTPVKYKDVAIGTVSGIALSDDASRVTVSVSFVKSAQKLLRADTRFWVVRPRIGMSGVSGIDTLISGAYIGVDAGRSPQPRRVFTGLETPPTVVNGTPGTHFTVQAPDLGSLDIGSPVYYRRIQVGRIASYALDANGRDVGLQIFVDAPYDRFVTTASRFWNASGVDVSLGADGLKLKTQSVATIMAGGIAFATPEDGAAKPAPAGSQFSLARDEQTAMATDDGPSQFIELRFNQPLRGLSVGAPVEFSGVGIGRVTSIKLDYDPQTQRFPTIVGCVAYPQRLGPVQQKLPRPGDDDDRQAARFLAGMVAHGLRAQARTGNLLTGQLYIALDFVPSAPKVAFDADARPLSIPTIDAGLGKMQEQLTTIVDKLSRMPLNSIGLHLDASLTDLDSTLRHIDGQVLPATTQTLGQARQSFGAARDVLSEDGPLQESLGQTLEELQRTARSLRALTDLLGRHPEAVLRGQTADPPPVPPATPIKTSPDREPVR